MKKWLDQYQSKGEVKYKTKYSLDNTPSQRQFISADEMNQNLFSQNQPKQYTFNADPNMNTPGRIELSQEMEKSHIKKIWDCGKIKFELIKH
jgi:hypothetical protein